MRHVAARPGRRRGLDTLAGGELRIGGEGEQVIMLIATHATTRLGVIARQAPRNSPRIVVMITSSPIASSEVRLSTQVRW